MKNVVLSLILALATVAAAQTTAKPTNELMGVMFGQPLAAQSSALTFVMLAEARGLMQVSGPRICDGSAFVEVVAGNVEELGCDFPMMESDTVIAALVAKLGKPTDRLEEVQNAFGAKAPRHNYEWKSGKMTVTFQTPGGAIDRCVLAVSTPAWKAANDARGKAAVKARQF